MPIELTDDMAAEINTAVLENRPCIVATCGEDNEPDLAIRGSMMVYDKEHLAFWERSRLESLENLRFNQKIAVFYRNIEKRIIWRFYGVATLHEEGEMRQKIMDRVLQRELDADPERKGYGVTIKVSRVRQGSNVIMSAEE
jgi:hypothetical protein